MENAILFSERQYWGILPYLILIAVNAILIISFSCKGAYKKQEGQRLPVNLSHGVTAFLLLLSIGFTLFRLDTRISTDGISLRFFPAQVQYKHYAWNTIDSAFVKEYAPLRDYNGWGIRGNAQDKVYSMSGSQGIQLVFKNGSRLLIGTNDPAEAQAALKKAGK